MLEFGDRYKLSAYDFEACNRVAIFMKDGVIYKWRRKANVSKTSFIEIIGDKVYLKSCSKVTSEVLRKIYREHEIIESEEPTHGFSIIEFLDKVKNKNRTPGDYSLRMVSHVVFEVSLPSYLKQDIRKFNIACVELNEEDVLNLVEQYKHIGASINLIERNKKY